MVKKEETKEQKEAREALEAAKKGPCICTEVEQAGGALPCPSCKDKGLRAWAGKGAAASPKHEQVIENNPELESKQKKAS